LTGAIINIQQNYILNTYFLVGAFADVLLIISAILIIKNIKKNTRAIKDL